MNKDCIILVMKIKNLTLLVYIPKLNIHNRLKNHNAVFFLYYIHPQYAIIYILYKIKDLVQTK